MAAKGPKPLQEGKRATQIKVSVKDHTKTWLQRIATAAKRSVSFVVREILEEKEPDDEENPRQH